VTARGISLLGVVGGAVGLLALPSSPARASELDAAGDLVASPGALLDVTFESMKATTALGASFLTMDANGALTTTPIDADSWGTSVMALPSQGIPSLQGSRALRIAVGDNLGMAVQDVGLFASLASERLTLTFWGYSVGAEPTLDLVYASTVSTAAGGASVGPYGLARVSAVRTGRETSDGWAEYSTGPVDGAVWGATPLSSIDLSARFATTEGTETLDVSPSSIQLLDTNAYALIDAVELVVTPGSPTAPTACSSAGLAMSQLAQSTETGCATGAECVLGRCVDGAFVWGPMPPADDHRSDMVARWAYTLTNLAGDRNGAALARATFTPTALAQVDAATTSSQLFGGLATLTNTVRAGHATMGFASTFGTVFADADIALSATSGYLDLCFGLSQDDLPGGSGTTGYAVYWLSPGSPVGGAAGGGVTLAVGDRLTAVDGIDPDTWLAAETRRFASELPPDPLALPAQYATILSEALKRATTASFSSCSAAGVCTAKTVAVGDLMYAAVNGTASPLATSMTRVCTGRFTDAVSGWTEALDAASGYGGNDATLTESAGGITSIELDGFVGAYDPTAADPYAAWWSPIAGALGSGEPLLVDARFGHGGYFPLGARLVQGIRGSDDPFLAFFAPAVTVQSADASWLFDPNLVGCSAGNQSAGDLCAWIGDINLTSAATALLPAGTRIAWVNGEDYSMNDIAPRLLVGDPDVRFFGPLPSAGAFGEASSVPPLLRSWFSGSIQAVDMREGADLAGVARDTWESGHGVVPDVVVVQKESDLLAGVDTTLAAARAWLKP
jgi:hypothetical protein